jgi:hypothetical protein
MFNAACSCLLARQPEDIAMLDYAFGFLARGAVMIPTILLVSAGLWMMLKKFGVLRLEEPFTASDMRTWPLSYALGEAAIFAVVFAAIAAALGNNQGSIAIGAGVASLIALGIVPALFARSQK